MKMSAIVRHYHDRIHRKQHRYLLLYACRYYLFILIDFLPTTVCFLKIVDSTRYTPDVINLVGAMNNVNPYIYFDIEILLINIVRFYTFVNMDTIGTLMAVEMPVCTPIPNPGNNSTSGEATRRTDILSMQCFKIDCIYLTFHIRKSYNIVYSRYYFVDPNNVRRIKSFSVQNDPGIAYWDNTVYGILISMVVLYGMYRKKRSVCKQRYVLHFVYMKITSFIFIDWLSPYTEYTDVGATFSLSVRVNVLYFLGLR